MKVILLGTGTSQGIPVIACECPTCKSDDPRNRRTRASVLISYAGRNIVVDTSTEFRLQMVYNGIKRLDAVLFTHAHADHVHGLDDIRQFNKIQQAVIPCYGSAETLESIRQKYDYVFKPTQEGGGKPDIALNEISGDFDLFGKTIVPLEVKHGVLDVLGFRVGKFAYITDASNVPEETLARLRGVEVLVINALRYIPHETHFSVGQAIDVIGKVRPRISYLTHLSHIIEHERLEGELPQNIHVGHDGLTLDIPD
jgi:phosphoribosyl 1,2-cyclic phosphate phosphodiesterase